MYTARVTVDMKRLEKAIGDLVVHAPEVLKATALATALDMARHAALTKLQAQVLRRRTGTLLRSVAASPRLQNADPKVATAVFGTHLGYGRAHEIGFHGVVQVRAHMRSGRPVRAHQMRMNIRARRYLRSSLRERKPAIRGRVARAFVALVRTGRVPSPGSLT